MSWMVARTERLPPAPTWENLLPATKTPLPTRLSARSRAPQSQQAGAEIVPPGILPGASERRRSWRPAGFNLVGYFRGDPSAKASRSVRCMCSSIAFNCVRSRKIKIQPKGSPICPGGRRPSSRCRSLHPWGACRWFPSGQGAHCGPATRQRSEAVRYRSPEEARRPDGPPVLVPDPRISLPALFKSAIRPSESTVSSRWSCSGRCSGEASRAGGGPFRAREPACSTEHLSAR